MVTLLLLGLPPYPQPLPLQSDKSKYATSKQTDSSCTPNSMWCAKALKEIYSPPAFDAMKTNMMYNNEPAPGATLSRMDSINLIQESELF